MKKFSFLLAFMSFSTFLLAQQTLVSFEPIAKKPKISALLSNANQDDILGISYHFNSKLYWNAVDKTGQVLEKKSYAVGTVRMRPKGAIFSNSNFFHFYKDMDNHQLKIIRATKDGHSAVLLTKKLLAKKDRFIGFIADRNVFCVLIVNKKEKVLKAFKFNPQTNDFDKTVFPVKDYILEKFHKVQFMSLKSGDLIGPQQAASLLKLYVLNDHQLLLTLDGAKAKGHSLTELITLNLATNELTSKAVGKNAYEFKDKTKSLVFKDHIYRIAATREKLAIEMYGLADLTLQKEYNFTKEDELSILDSPFFTENENSNGFYLFNPARKAKIVNQPATKKLFKKLAVGAPFIIASAFGDQQTLLTIGTYIATNAGGGYFMPGMPGGTITTPNGPVSMPGTPGSWVDGRATGYKQSRFFYSLMNSNDLTHIEAVESINKSVHPVHKFVNNTLTDKHISTVIPYGDQTAVVSYLRSDKEIKITLINPQKK